MYSPKYSYLYFRNLYRNPATTQLIIIRKVGSQPSLRCFLLDCDMLESHLIVVVIVVVIVLSILLVLL